MSAFNVPSTLSDFAIGKEIGRGAYSTVFKARRLSDNKFYALKKIEFGRFSQREKDNALLEISILSSIKNNNIIHLHEAFLEEDCKWLW